MVHVTDVISIACLIQVLFIRSFLITIYMCCRHRSTTNRILIQIILRPIGFCYKLYYQFTARYIKLLDIWRFTFHQAVHQTAYWWHWIAIHQPAPVRKSRLKFKYVCLCSPFTVTNIPLYFRLRRIMDSYLLITR